MPAPDFSVRGSWFLNPRERFIWQRLGFSPGENAQSSSTPNFLVNHRIRGAEDYKHHDTYIWENSIRQSGLERETGAVCVVIGASGNGIGRPATRAKALNLYTRVFTRV